MLLSCSLNAIQVAAGILGRLSAVAFRGLFD
jgi:hypothetical protein